MREGREEGGEEVVLEDAGCVEGGGGGEEVGVGCGVVETGGWEGHFCGEDEGDWGFVWW